MALSINEIEEIDKKTSRNDEDLAAVFKVLSDPRRCRIFRLLLNDSKGDLGVGDVARLSNMSMSSASQHLKLLESAGLVKKERWGQRSCFVAYKMNPVVRALVRYVL